jgi:hypothetical protein
VDSPFSIAANDCPAALDPGASCAVSVTYAPVALGPASASLHFTHALGTTDVALEGSGIDIKSPVISRFSIRPNHFNPKLRSVAISFRSNEPGRADVVVKKGRRVIRTLALNKRILASTQVTMSWNGKDKFKRLVKAGIYKVVVTARDAAGNKSTKSLEVLVIRN